MRRTCDLDLAGPLGGPVQDDLLGGLQVGLVCPRLHVEDGPGGYKHAGGDNIERLSSISTSKQPTLVTSPAEEGRESL